MKRLVTPLAVACFALATPALAAPPNLNWGAQISAGHCQDGTGGQLIINVTLQVVNSIDSGVASNYWANENYNETVQVWAQADGSYCARVLNLGRFAGVQGETSPGGGGTMAGTEKGSFEGGYWATITGTLKASPAWPTNGHAGTIDLQCDAQSGTCANPVRWAAQYFETGYGFTYNFWGWTYHGGRNGSWVNASTGNSGDIFAR